EKIKKNVRKEYIAMKIELSTMAAIGRTMCRRTLRTYAAGCCGGGASIMPPNGNRRRSAAKIRIRKMPSNQAGAADVGASAITARSSVLPYRRESERASKIDAKK